MTAFDDMESFESSEIPAYQEMNDIEGEMVNNETEFSDSLQTLEPSHNVSFGSNLDDLLSEAESFSHECRMEIARISPQINHTNFTGDLDSLLNEARQLVAEDRAFVNRLSMEEGIDLHDPQNALDYGIRKGFEVLDDIEQRHPDDWQARVDHNLEMAEMRREAEQHLQDLRIEQIENQSRAELNMTQAQYDLTKEGYHQVFPQAYTYGLPKGDGNWFEKDGDLFYLNSNGTLDKI